MLQVAQLSRRDRATHELFRFAKLRSGIFEPPFRRLRGKVGALPVGKRLIDFLQVINEHLASCYSWGTTSRNISNSALCQGGASLWRYIWGWRVSVSPTSMYRSTGEWVYYNYVAGRFLSKKLCSRLHSTEDDFYCKKGKVRFLSHRLGDLEVTYAVKSRCGVWDMRADN